MKISRHRVRDGFTLVELLVVVGIITIIAAISMMGLSDINRTAEYADAGSSVLSRMHMARQLAIAKNKTVEVRFYKSDEFGDDSANLWQGMAVVIPGDTVDDNPQAQGEVYFLPSALSIDPAPDHSALLDPSELSSLDPLSEEGEPMGSTLSDDESIFAQMDGKEYVAFQYRPDGSTNLDLDKKWFLTIREKEELLRAEDKLKNYSTIILNPYSGRGSIYRP